RAGGNGILQAVQGRIDSSGQRRVHALDPGDLLDPGGLEATQSAEMLEQARAPARPDAGNVLQPADAARLLATAAVAGDGEAVGFVAHLLDQLQAWRIRTWPQLATVGQEQALVAGASFLALGHADDDHAGAARRGGG